MACFIIGSVGFRIATGSNHPTPNTFERRDLAFNGTRASLVPTEVYNIHTEDKIEAFVQENLDAYSFARMYGKDK
jgi:hypothetical protein